MFIELHASALEKSRQSHLAAVAWHHLYMRATKVRDEVADGRITSVAEYATRIDKLHGEYLLVSAKQPASDKEAFALNNKNLDTRWP
jgi:hypothetical protein